MMSKAVAWPSSTSLTKGTRISLLSVVLEIFSKFAIDGWVPNWRTHGTRDLRGC
jgi:hypothetical protein